VEGDIDGGIEVMGDDEEDIRRYWMIVKEEEDIVK
jgi:hypothetical protein